MKPVGESTLPRGVIPPRRGVALTSLRSHRLWRAVTETPVIVTVREMAQTVAAIYVVGGVLALISLSTRSGVTNLAPQVGLAACAVVNGVLIWIFGARMRIWFYHCLIAAGTLMVTAIVVLNGDAPSSVGYMTLYVCIAVDCCFFFSWLVGAAHIVLAELCCGAAAAQVGLSISDTIIVQGGVIVVGAAVGRLARIATGATIDPLTRLANRRGFDTAMAATFAEAVRTRGTLSVIALDLDYFKTVNDVGGHAEGDRTLTYVASMWSKQLRERQLLCRLGGDEFLVILPNCGAERAMLVADQLRMSVRNWTTCSAGVAEYCRDENAADLLSRADEALYRAKTDGRDRTAYLSPTG